MASERSWPQPATHGLGNWEGYQRGALAAFSAHATWQSVSWLALREATKETTGITCCRYAASVPQPSSPLGRFMTSVTLGSPRRTQPDWNRPSARKGGSHSVCGEREGHPLVSTEEAVSPTQIVCLRTCEPAKSKSCTRGARSLLRDLKCGRTGVPEGAATRCDPAQDAWRLKHASITSSAWSAFSRLSGRGGRILRTLPCLPMRPIRTPA